MFLLLKNQSQTKLIQFMRLELGPFSSPICFVCLCLDGFFCRFIFPREHSGFSFPKWLKIKIHKYKNNPLSLSLSASNWIPIFFIDHLHSYFACLPRFEMKFLNLNGEWNLEFRLISKESEKVVKVNSIPWNCLGFRKCRLIIYSFEKLSTMATYSCE